MTESASRRWKRRVKGKINYVECHIQTVEFEKTIGKIKLHIYWFNDPMSKVSYTD
jgi:hypothetical protein